MTAIALVTLVFANNDADDWWLYAAESVANVFTNCGNNEIIGDVCWYCDVAHSRFGVRTCGALADVIGSTGLRLIAVDEMVMDFMLSAMNLTTYVQILELKIEKEQKKIAISLKIYN